MKDKMLPISLILHLLFILAFLVLIHKLGGWSQLVYKIKNSGLAGTYQHRFELLETLPLTESDIVFLGNSLTQFCEWSEILQRPNVKNRGIAGDGVEGVLKRLPTILKAKPKAIFLMIGINDLFYHHSDYVIQHYESILQQCASVSPQTKVFVQSVLPVNGDIKSIPIKNQDIVRLNKGIKNLGQHFQMPFIDLHPLFCKADGQLNPDFSVDGIHINGKGYAIWAAEVEKYMTDL